MPTYTVLLIPGTEVGWMDVRALLHAMPDVRVVGETAEAADAVALTHDEQPRMILSATTIANVSALSLLTALRQQAPTSRLLLFAPRFTVSELAAYADLGTAGFVVWGDLTCAALRDCLTVVLEADVHVSSQSAVDAFMETVRDPTRLRAAHVRLTEREQVVLRRLAEGRTHKQITDAEGMSERTVKRIMVSLQVKLDAPSQFVLGKRAAQLGLIP